MAVYEVPFKVYADADCNCIRFDVPKRLTTLESYQLSQAITRALYEYKEKTGKSIVPHTDALGGIDESKT